MVRIKVYHGPVVAPKGEIGVDVNIANVVKKCRFVVVQGATKALIVRDIWRKIVLTLDKNGAVTLNEKLGSDAECETKMVY